MSVRHRVLVASLASGAMLALPAAPSYAAAPTDVYVTSGGTDNGTCAFDTPCATVAAGIFAVGDGGTIHVGPGTFDGAVRPGALSKSVSIVGASADSTFLTASPGSQGYDFTVVEIYAGVTTGLSDLTVTGDSVTVPLLVEDSSTVVAHDIVVDTGPCALAVLNGEVDLTDSTVQHGKGDCSPVSGNPLSGDIGLRGGTLHLTRTRILAPAQNLAGVDMQGGTLTVDQSFVEDPNSSDNSHGIEVGGGTSTIQHSTFHGWGQGVDVEGGTATVADSTFQDDIVGVNRGAAGSVTVVRSTFEHELASLQGSVSVAGSVLGSKVAVPAYGIQECNPSGGTITDLGYNLSSDASCGFTEPTSQESVTDLNLDTALADRGGPQGLLTVATFWGSPAVDLIPVGATYGPSPTPLCPATTASDLRGVPRPQAGACDAGSTELAATATTLKAPRTATPHAHVLLDATVTVPDVGVEGLELPVGTVTFRSDGVRLCDVPMDTHSNEATCSTTSLGAGAHSLRATFTPVADGSTLHAGTVTRTIEVGTTPAFTSKARATFTVGTSHTFRVRASGSPTPRVTLVKGRLPAGLHFHAGTGSATITGRARASAVGSRSVTVQATNLRGSVRQVLRIVVARR